MSTTTNRWRWLAFAAALAATLMDLLDSTIANVAAPFIAASSAAPTPTCSGSRRPTPWPWP